MMLILRLARSVMETTRLLAEILKEMRSQHEPPVKEVWFDTTQAARLLGVTVRTIYTYKTNGTLKPVRIGRRDYFRESDIFRLQ